MPKSSKYFATDRQWQMLKLVPQRPPGITVRDLVRKLADAGYPVSRRTVERDLNEQSRQFGLTNSKDPSGRVQCWYFAANKVPDLGSVDLVDAVSLTLAGDVLKQLLPTVLLEPVNRKISKARTRLKDLDNLPLARWSQKVRYVPSNLSFNPPSIPRRIMRAVQTALIEEKQMEVSYAPFGKKPHQLRMHPLSLIQRDNVPYLLATTFEYTDLRIFAIHRLSKVEVLEEKAVIPPDFSVDDYISGKGMEFGSAKIISLKARLSEKLASYLMETRLNSDQKIVYRNNSWELTSSVRDTWQLRFWLLSQAADLTVEKPLSLRKELTAQLQQAIERYQPKKIKSE